MSMLYLEWNKGNCGCFWWHWDVWLFLWLFLWFCMKAGTLKVNASGKEMFCLHWVLLNEGVGYIIWGYTTKMQTTMSSEKGTDKLAVQSHTFVIPYVFPHPHTHPHMYTHTQVKLSGHGKVLTYGPVDALDTGLMLTCNVRALDRTTIFSSHNGTITVQGEIAVFTASAPQYLVCHISD